MQSANTLSSIARGSIVLLASSLAWASEPEQGSSGSAVNAQDAQKVIQEWPDSSKKAANHMMEKYGQPDGITENHLVWLDNGPWVRTIVHKQEVQHDFPKPHKDVLEQFINYEVPEDKFSDLARYDGSVVAYRTNGELSARCDREAANILALNLAHDIVEGRRSVEDAREFYANAIQQVMQGEQPEYVRSLQFETRTASATADPGEQVIAASGQAAASARDASEPTAQDRSEATETEQTRERRRTEDETAISSARLTGMTVVSADGEEVGEISRVMDKQGEEYAEIQLRDGFLGVGESEITLPVSDLSVTPDGKIRTSMTRDQLEAHQERENKVGGEPERVDEDLDL